MIWNWRKLLVAGLAICGLVTSGTVKRVGSSIVLKHSILGFILWVVGLLVFWYAYLEHAGVDSEDAEPEANSQTVVKDFSTSSSNNDSSGNRESNWARRFKETEGLQNGDARLPVTVVTGFLGSGKTSLVKHILGNAKGLKILVIENEIGNEGIDHELLLQQVDSEEIILMENGCVCCTVRKDLIQTFHRMFENDAFGNRF